MGKRADAASAISGIKRLYKVKIFDLPYGGLAQLGERHVRNVEAAGSTPVPSTNFNAYRSYDALHAYTPLSFLQMEYT